MPIQVGPTADVSRRGHCENRLKLLQSPAHTHTHARTHARTQRRDSQSCRTLHIILLSTSIKRWERISWVGHDADDSTREHGGKQIRE